MEKIDPKLLLGLNKLPEDKEAGEDLYSCVIIVNGRDEHGCKLAQPAVANTKRLRTANGVDVVFPFPQRERFWPRDRAVLSRRYIRRVDRPNPFDNYKTRTMRLFVHESVDILIAAAKTYGVVSFFLTPKAGIGFLDHIYWLLNKFKYHTAYSQNTRSLSDSLCTEKDTILPVVTVFDIPLCIPVLNKKRCDGIGLNYEIILPKSTEYEKSPATLGCLTILLSNFRDNLFYLDGINILEEQPIDRDIVNKFKHQTSTKIDGNGKKVKRGTYSGGYTTYASSDTFYKL